VGVLRFIWQRVLAFDRIGSRIPQLIQGESTFYWRVTGIVGLVILVDLGSGGQALLLAESQSVADFRGVMQRTGDGELRATGKVIDEITDDQRTYDGFAPDDFGAPPPAGCGMVLLSYRCL
jgi:hypothetical protein